MSPRGKYEIRIGRSAEKEMNRLPVRVFERVADAILGIEHEPRPRGSKKLRGVEDYRLRVGAYRILYSVDDRVSWSSPRSATGATCIVQSDPMGGAQG